MHKVGANASQRSSQQQSNCEPTYLKRYGTCAYSRPANRHQFEM